MKKEEIKYIKKYRTNDIKNRVDIPEKVGYNDDTGKRCAWLLEIKEADVLKLEIKMDEKKIVADRKYQVESI